MQLMEEVMESEIEGIGKFLNLIEYKQHIFARVLSGNFEKIIHNFSSLETELEIDKEIRKIQFLILKIEMEKDDSGLINFMTGRIKHFLNNYLVAYIILKKLKEEPLTGSNLFPSSITVCKEQKDQKNINNAINLVQSTELEFDRVREFIKMIKF